MLGLRRETTVGYLTKGEPHIRWRSTDSYAEGAIMTRYQYKRLSVSTYPECFYFNGQRSAEFASSPKL